MMLEGLQPIPKESDANTLKYPVSMPVLGAPSQPLDKTGWEFHGSQQPGSIVLFQQELNMEDWPPLSATQKKNFWEPRLSVGSWNRR